MVGIGLDDLGLVALAVFGAEVTIWVVVLASVYQSLNGPDQAYFLHIPGSAGLI